MIAKKEVGGGDININTSKKNITPSTKQQKSVVTKTTKNEINRYIFKKKKKGIKIL